MNRFGLVARPPNDSPAVNLRSLAVAVGLARCAEIARAPHRKENADSDTIRYNSSLAPMSVRILRNIEKIMGVVARELIFVGRRRRRNNAIA